MPQRRNTRAHSRHSETSARATSRRATHQSHASSRATSSRSSHAGHSVHARPSAAGNTVRRNGRNVSVRSGVENRRSSGGRSSAPNTPKMRQAQAAEHNVTLPGGQEFTLTRRHFLYGVAGACALTAVGTGVAWAGSQTKGSESAETLTVPEANVTSQDELTAIEDYTEALTLAGSVQLPFGSLVWASCDDVAACLLPTEVAKPLTQIGIIDLQSATSTTVLEQAVGQDEGFEIFDVRANTAGIIWAEADIMDGTWRIYNATLSGTTMGEPQLLDSGDENWEMPTLAVAGSYAFWQCLPQLDGNARVENSSVKRAAFGSTTSEVVYTSKGRMSCAPTSYGDGIVATPRALSSSTHYQLTNIDAATGKTQAACVLPASMKPFECGWGKTGFSFAFDGIYDYGDGIANMGTYFPMTLPDTPSLADKEETTDAGPTLPIVSVNTNTTAYSDTTWFHFLSTPLSAPCWCGNWVLVRGSSYVCAIDLENKRYAQLPLEDGSSDYGDFLASTHIGSRAVTACNIDYTPISGDAVKECLVRIWEPTK